MSFVVKLFVVKKTLFICKDQCNYDYYISKNILVSLICLYSNR